MHKESDIVCWLKDSSVPETFWEHDTEVILLAYFRSNLPSCSSLSRAGSEEPVTSCRHLTDYRRIISGFLSYNLNITAMLDIRFSKSVLLKFIFLAGSATSLEDLSTKYLIFGRMKKYSLQYRFTSQYLVSLVKRWFISLVIMGL